MGEASRKASPILDVAALAQLGADEAARRGLRAIIREGRKSGLDVVQVAGVTISAGARSGQQVQQQVPKPRRRRPKTAAQKQASKEVYKQQASKATSKRTRTRILTAAQPSEASLQSCQRSNPTYSASRPVAARP